MTTCRNVDVTPQILDHHRIYGASDSTNHSYLSSSRCLNYSNGGSIQKPETDKISNIPRDIKYQDTVGLFGAENHFVKTTLALQNPISFQYTINDYKPATVGVEIVAAGDEYTYDNGPTAPGQAIVDRTLDLTTENTYEPALSSVEIIPNLQSLYFKIELKNLKTGNKYIDSWLDVRLYNKYREEHPYDTMYIKQGEFFYIGFHARNTKRLPYNVICEVAQPSDVPKLPPFGILEEIDTRYLSTKS